jgi:hypothetical protein
MSSSPGDCIESHDEEQHVASLRYMDGKLGRGMGNDEILRLLQNGI